jgi:hypothetical protein
MNEDQLIKILINMGNMLYFYYGGLFLNNPYVFIYLCYISYRSNLNILLKLIFIFFGIFCNNIFNLQDMLYLVAVTIVISSVIFILTMYFTYIYRNIISISSLQKQLLLLTYVSTSYSLIENNTLLEAKLSFMLCPFYIGIISNEIYKNSNLINLSSAILALLFIKLFWSIYIINYSMIV